MNSVAATKKMTCLTCASRCGMLLHTHEGKLVKVEGDPEHPVSRGWTCSAGRASTASQHLVAQPA
jgi:anaerobic selenocysteine-containing dehydrogenase